MVLFDRFCKQKKQKKENNVQSGFFVGPTEMFSFAKPIK